MEKKNNKLRIKRRLTFLWVSLIILLVTPGILGYAVGIPALDLYSVLVDYLFGSFWIATFAVIALMMFIMMVLGGLSLQTVLQYQMFFILAISIAYWRFAAMFSFVVIVSWTIYQIYKWVNSGGAY